MLRLYPPVPASAFVAIEDTMLPTGGGKDGKHPIFIQKGQYIGSSIYAMHRRKDIYGPDAEIFRLERWEDKSLRPGYTSRYSPLLPRYTQLVLIYHRWPSSLLRAAIRADGTRIYDSEAAAGIRDRGIAR